MSDFSEDLIGMIYELIIAKFFEDINYFVSINSITKEVREIILIYVKALKK